MLRYLRIAATVLCVTVCVLLTVLWVRSYGRREYVALRASNTVTFSAVSLRGRIVFLGDVQPVDRRPGLIAWMTETEPVTGWNLRWLGEPIQRAKWGVGIQRLTLGVVGFAVQMPHWFLILLLGTIALVTSAKRPYRFSMRTLLIATTMVAIVLGVIAIAK